MCAEPLASQGNAQICAAASACMPRKGQGARFALACRGKEKALVLVCGRSTAPRLARPCATPCRRSKEIHHLCRVRSMSVKLRRSSDGIGAAKTCTKQERHAQIEKRALAVVGIRCVGPSPRIAQRGSVRHRAGGARGGGDRIAAEGRRGASGGGRVSVVGAGRVHLGWVPLWVERRLTGARAARDPPSGATAVGEEHRRLDRARRDLESALCRGSTWGGRQGAAPSQERGGRPEFRPRSGSDFGCV